MCGAWGLLRCMPAYLVKGDAVLLQDRGRDEGHLVTEEGLAALEAVGEEP